MSSERIEPAQRTAARIAGFLYLVQMAIAMFVELFVRGRLVVAGDAVQTAKNIAGSPLLFRIGIVGDLLVYSTVIVLIVALYVVLRKVDRNIAVLALSWRVAECAILAAGTVCAFAAVWLVGEPAYLRALGTAELQALARMFLGLQWATMQVGFLFLGLGSAAFSYLWLKSRYIPRALAILGIIASLLMAVFSLGVIAFPGFGTAAPVFMAPMFFYEVGLGAWLLAKGIRAERAA